MASKASGKSKASKSVARSARKAVKAVKKSAKKAVAKAAKPAKVAKSAKASGSGKAQKAQAKVVKKASKAQKLLSDVASLARSARKKLASVIDSPASEKPQAVTPFLNLNGAQEAIEFYKQAFGAEEQFRMPNADGTIMHAELTIGGSRIMLSDASRFPVTKSTLHLRVDDCDATFEKALSAGGVERRSPTDMFWGERLSEVEDPFGNLWSIATRIEELAPDEVARRAAEFNAASTTEPASTEVTTSNGE